MKHTSKPRRSKPKLTKYKGSGGAGRNERRALAKSTLEIIEAGHYTFEGIKYDLRSQFDAMLSGTHYYDPDSLSSWEQPVTPANELARDTPTEISIVEVSTLEGAGFLSSVPYASEKERRRRVGVLNFASAKKPGGGFQSGAQAQEESIARSSTLYPSLVSSTAEKFYRLHHKNPKGGYYSHAMILSPNVTVFRTDAGRLAAPMEIDVVTSAAVNAGVARRTLHGMVAGAAEEVRIAKAMKERMGRILYLFEEQGIKDLVLGSFGTGVFQNKVPVVAAIWAELLLDPDARFANSFDRVVFAILGRETFVEFKDIFEERQLTK
ncbi:hypothetical protein BJ322DRAFT_892272 [Thelephora terrestris]|uniref:Microbial-type PARG catalytic domain-containing protein n=1 Tax=Thelephora terrestris TaxID=56493 RepID=A0A9P6HFC0_9AGAM|nr:hypothetical protein BJ322DRAFT_892272 [Thelephora terrestris]